MQVEVYKIFPAYHLSRIRGLAEKHDLAIVEMPDPHSVRLAGRPALHIYSEGELLHCAIETDNAVLTEKYARELFRGCAELQAIRNPTEEAVVSV